MLHNDEYSEDLEQLKRCESELFELRRTAALGSELAKLPDDGIWGKIDKTEDLENFYIFQKSSHSKIAKAFASMRIGRLFDGALESLYPIERCKIFPQGIQECMPIDKREHELILLLAESWDKELQVIDESFPYMLEEGLIEHEDFQSSSQLFLEFIRIQSHHEIEVRSGKYHEVSRSNKAEAWQAINDLSKEIYEARQDKVEVDWQSKIKSLYTRSKIPKNDFCEGLYQWIIYLSKENEKISELLQSWKKVHRELCNEASKDWELRLARGYKHNSEIWMNGERYIVSKNNRTIRAPYDSEQVHMIYGH